MFLVLVLLLVPAAIFQAMSAHGQSVTLTCASVLLAVLFLGLAIRVAREIRAFNAVRHVAGHHWRPGQCAEDFQLALINHVRAGGAKVLWSRVAARDRVGFAIERPGGRHGPERAVLLCLAPGARPLNEDLRQAGLWQTEAGARIAVMVTQTGAAAPVTSAGGAAEMPRPRLLRYEALQDLSRLFQTGA